MKVYLASWFADINCQNVHAEELRKAGIEVTSRWLEETIKPSTPIHEVGDDYLRETARVDLEDIMKANYVVLNVPSIEELQTLNVPVKDWARGGRHFEAGFQYAMTVFRDYMPYNVKCIGPRGVILVGRRENVFHYLDGVMPGLKALNNELPQIPMFTTWDGARDYLITISRQQVESTASAK